MSDQGVRKEHTHREIMIILGGLMTGLLLAALDQTIVSTALKNIVEDFNGLNHYTWVVTSYLLTSTASTPLYGKISEFIWASNCLSICDSHIPHRLIPCRCLNQHDLSSSHLEDYKGLAPAA